MRLSYTAWIGLDSLFFKIVLIMCIFLIKICILIAKKRHRVSDGAVRGIGFESSRFRGLVKKL